MRVESEQKATQIPFYTKVGSVAALILMAILIAMMFRNCAGAVKYGSQTEKAMVDTYYQLGITDGRLDKEFYLPADVKENPVLHKAYNKGYREGIDERQLAGQ